MTVEETLKSLNENTGLYAGKSASETARMRGQMLASLIDKRFNNTVLPYLLEELQNGRHPYLIGGAARGLRGSAKQLPETIPFLLLGFEKLGHGDDILEFEENGRMVETTATNELLSSLEWMGASATRYLSQIREIQLSSRVNLSDSNKTKLEQIILSIESTIPVDASDCCENVLPDGWQHFQSKWFSLNKKPAAGSIKIEDQDANLFNYLDYFSGRPSLVAFFYTRCDNPDKCTLTVTMMAQLQHLLDAKGLKTKVNIAAFTYDPYFDNPSRLKQYGESRGLQFNDYCKSFRVIEGFEHLQKHFDLGVNYNGTVVNKHKIELYLLDKKGMIAGSSTRLRWNNDKIIKQAEMLLRGKAPNNNIVGKFLHNALSALMLIGFAFAPKCPLCWAAYISVFGISSSTALTFSKWLLPLFIAGFFINLLVTYKMAKKKSLMLPVYLSIAGAVSIVMCSYVFHWKEGNILGLVLLLSSSMIVSLPRQVISDLRGYLILRRRQYSKG